MTDLPVNIDSTYADDGEDASVQEHQEHHDTLHALHNAIDGASSDPSSVGLAALDGATFTGAVLLPDGSTSAPAIAFAADPDTGVSWVSANRGELVAGGARIMSWRGTDVLPGDDGTIDLGIPALRWKNISLSGEVKDGSGNTKYAKADGEYAVNTVAASGSTETLTLAPAHDVTMDESCTFTFPSPTAGHTFLLLLSGAFTPTFPASVDWDSATAPTYESPSLYGFTTLDGGTTWVGTLVASGLG